MFVNKGFICPDFESKELIPNQLACGLQEMMKESLDILSDR